VIEGGVRYEIRFQDESTVDANVIGYDTEVDIAVVTFSGEGLDFIEISSLGNSTDNMVSEFLLDFLVFFIWFVAVICVFIFLKKI